MPFIKRQLNTNLFLHKFYTDLWIQRLNASSCISDVFLGSVNVKHLKEIWKPPMSKIVIFPETVNPFGRLKKKT